MDRVCLSWTEIALTRSSAHGQLVLESPATLSRAVSAAQLISLRGDNFANAVMLAIKLLLTLLVPHLTTLVLGISTLQRPPPGNGLEVASREEQRILPREDTASSSSRILAKFSAHVQEIMDVQKNEFAQYRLRSLYIRDDYMHASLYNPVPRPNTDIYEAHKVVITLNLKTQVSQQNNIKGLVEGRAHDFPNIKMTDLFLFREQVLEHLQAKEATLDMGYDPIIIRKREQPQVGGGRSAEIDCYLPCRHVSDDGEFTLSFKLLNPSNYAHSRT